MHYYDFLQRGLPIGSGPIEAAAKTIVRQRMCRSGMSWSCEKGQYILTVKESSLIFTSGLPEIEAAPFKYNNKTIT